MITMNSINWVCTLLLVMLVSMSYAPVVAADPLVLDDDLKEIEARFNNELEKMRNQFREELSRAQQGPRLELQRAKERIRELETELATQIEVNASLVAKNASLEEALVQANGATGVPVTDSGQSPRGYLGISIVEMSANQARQLEIKSAESVLIESVDEGSTASEMGLKAGDAIFTINNQGASYDNLVAILQNKKVGESITAEWARLGADGVLKVSGRGVLKAAEEAVEVSCSIPAIPLEEPGPPAPEPTPVVKPGISLGVNVLQSEGFGLQVTSVTPGSNAAVAGLKVGDVITAFGDAKIRTIEGLRDVLVSTFAGSQSSISFIRGEVSWVSVIQFGGGDLAATLIDGPMKAGNTASGDSDAPTGRGFLGVVPVERGDLVVVSEVIAGSCAEKMGLQQGDLLVAVAGKMVTSIDKLRDALAPNNAGDSIMIRFARSGEPMTVEGVLGNFPVSEGQSSLIESVEDVARLVPSSATVKVKEVIKPRGNSKLGIVVGWDADGAYIDSILPGSGAGAAGAQIGDRIIRVETMPIGSLEQIGEVLASTMVDAPVSLQVLRGLESLNLVVHRREVIDSLDLPEVMDVAAMQPPVLGIEVEENAIGILLTEIHDGMPAAEAGLQRGDWIIRICDMEIRSIEDIQDSLQYSGLVEIPVTIRRDLEIIQTLIPLQRR